VKKNRRVRNTAYRDLSEDSSLYGTPYMTDWAGRPITVGFSDSMLPDYSQNVHYQFSKDDPWNPESFSGNNIHSLTYPPGASVSFEAPAGPSDVPVLGMLGRSTDPYRDWLGNMTQYVDPNFSQNADNEEKSYKNKELVKALVLKLLGM
jgi:hypothetical protein